MEKWTHCIDFRRSSSLRVIATTSLILTLIVFGAGYAHAYVVRLTLIDYADFRNIGSNTYLSKSLPEEAELKVLSLLESARKRVSDQYGEVSATPVTVVLGGKRERKQYGLDGPPGTFLFVPWGGYLLLDYEAASVDVTAHELVHAEVVKRVGYIRRQLDIPTWFDEGAAMQVDHRKKYTLGTMMNHDEFSSIVRVDTPSKFWTSDKAQNINHYRQAKAAMAVLLKHSGESLYGLLGKVRQDEGNVIAVATDKTRKALQP